MAKDSVRVFNGVEYRSRSNGFANKDEAKRYARTLRVVARRKVRVVKIGNLFTVFVGPARA